MDALQVLVADDEPVSRTVVGAMLKKAGYVVQYAPDGEEAWKRLDSQKPPALALLDWEMPGLQGPEVVERIRQKQAQAPTYVILLTSRDSSADIVRGLRAGADDYVCKPANEDELIARVNVGARVVQLQLALADRVRSLEEALANVRAIRVRVSQRAERSALGVSMVSAGSRRGIRRPELGAIFLRRRPRSSRRRLARFT